MKKADSIHQLVLLYDAVIYRCEGKFYTKGVFEMQIAKCFPEITDVYQYARIKDATANEIKGYTPYDTEQLMPCRIHVIGPENQSAGLFGYFKTMPLRYKQIKKILKKPSIVISDYCTPAGLIANYCVYSKKHFFISRLVGEFDVLLSMNKFKIARAIVAFNKYSFFRMQRRVSLQTWVSQKLEREYADNSIPSVVYNDNHIRETQIVKGPLRRSCGENLRIVFCGRLSPEKGIFDLLEAIRLLKDEPVELSILGDGPLRGDIESRIKTYDIMDKVKLYGYVKWGEDLFKILRENHVFCLPSYSEGLPTAIIEAMSFGLSVIASDVGSISELVNSDNGMLFPPHDVNAIANCIMIYANNDAARLSAAKASISFAHDNTIEKQLEKLQLAYEHSNYIPEGN